VSGTTGGADARLSHWTSVYATREADEVSWYQAQPETSLEVIAGLGVGLDAAVIDVGGGASFLADRLVERGYTDLTVLDVAMTVLEWNRRRLPADSPVTLLRQDVLTWQPARLYDLWHDRALFHFFVADGDRSRYLDTMHAALRPGGIAIVATFAPDGPDHCSGLPVSRYSADDLACLFGEFFLPVASRREEHATPGGVRQPFTWYVGRRRSL
jgi:SAM-dependent methyltransferase